jgi:hypothetical protein
MDACMNGWMDDIGERIELNLIELNDIGEHECMHE